MWTLILMRAQGVSMSSYGRVRVRMRGVCAQVGAVRCGKRSRRWAAAVYARRCAAVLLLAASAGLRAIGAHINHHSCRRDAMLAAVVRVLYSRMWYAVAES